jgi:hypothetical protein
MVLDVVAAELDRLHEPIAGRFARSEPRGPERLPFGRSAYPGQGPKAERVKLSRERSA